MKEDKRIFSHKKIESIISNYDISDIEDYKEKIKLIERWKYSIDNHDLNKTKEKQLQGTFLLNFMCKILGYRGQIGRKDWTFIQEQKTKKDGSTPDGVLGFFNNDYKDTRVIIELKDATTDLDEKQKNRNYKLSPVEQAFFYVPKFGGTCKWVIVSNFKEIRLYNSADSLAYEKFEVTKLIEENEFKRFYYLLNRNNLISPSVPSVIDELYTESKEYEKCITQEFYIKYKEIRLNLFNGFKENNTEIDDIVLFQKAQKLLDRFIFICFSESSNLLPKNIFLNLISNAHSSLIPTDENIWLQLKGLFNSIDKGNLRMNINRFNGGLFAEDEILDNLKVPDDLFAGLEVLATYDFSTDLNVNILGHIFEQSISDIEEIKSQIEGKEVDKKNSKRKKDGIFYTEEYVTHYMVEECIGSWLEEQRKRLGQDNLPIIPEKKTKMTPSEKAKYTKAIKANEEFWKKYSIVLENIKVLDPACGSGAFLNAAFDYLYREGIRANKQLAKITGQQTSLFDLDKNILNNNLYGVDLNEESVEITKLSLWLKTANKTKPLTTLDNNIFCGNSIVNDIKYSGDKSFDWRSKFGEIIDNGGFDIILGNPPYVRQERIVEIKPYLKKNYKVYSGRCDLYVYFFEKAINLLKDNGKMCFICSSKYTKAGYGKNLRELIIDNCKVESFIDFGDLEVFKGIIAYASIIVLEKEKLKVNREENLIKYCNFKVLDKNLKKYIFDNKKNVIQKKLTKNEWTFDSELIDEYKKSASSDLKTILEFFGKPKTGIKTGRNIAYILTEDEKKKITNKDIRSEQIIKPYLFGEDIRAYYCNPKQYIIFPYKETDKGLELINIEDYQAVKEHLELYREELESRAIIKEGLISGKKVWYEYQQISKEFSLEKTYIVYPNMSNRGSFSLSKGNAVDMTAFMLDMKGIEHLAVLNSEVIDNIIKAIAIERRGGFRENKTQYISKVPYPILNDLNKDTLFKLSNEIYNITQEYYKKINLFINYISATYNVRKVTKNITDFHNRSYESLLDELKKQSIILNNIEKYDLKILYDREVNDILQLQRKISFYENKSNMIVESCFMKNDNRIDTDNRK